jgi:hypothetical protein
LIVLIKRFGVSNLFTRTQGNKASHSNIQANSIINGMQSFVSRIVDPQTNKPSSRRFKSNGYGTRFTPLWQLPRPFNCQWLRTLSQIYLSILPPESRLSEFCTATATLVFEVGVSCPASKEVGKCSLQMSQALLQWHTTNLIQKLEVFKFFPLRQHGGGLSVIYSLLPVVPCLGSCRQCSVKNQPHTANCPAQYLFLLGSWVKTVAVGFLHTSHFTTFHVKPSFMTGFQTQEF